MNTGNESHPETTHLNRRNFIGATAAAGAASALPLTSSAQVKGSDTIKIALIGCGGRGSGASNQALNNEGVELVAMADAFSDRLDSSLENLKKQHPDKIKVSDDKKFIGLDAYKLAIAEADLVILATPPGFRPSHFEEAIAQNKHVFMEKPVAVDAPGVRKVLAAAKEADAKNLKVVCGLQRRYQNNYTQAYEKFKEGAIGDIISGQVYWNSSGVWVRSRKDIATTLGRQPTEMEYQMYNWYYFNWVCGDHIVEQHIHNIDVFNWFKGAHPIKAQGMGGREVRDGNPDYGEIYDHHFVEFHYEDGSVLNSQCRHIKNTYSNVSEIITGTKGTLKTNSRPQATITGLDGKRSWRYREEEAPNPYQTEHDILQQHIREDKPINNAYYTAESTFTAILGRYATYSGKLLSWDEALANGSDLFPEKLAWDAMPKVLPGADGRYPAAIPGEFDPYKA